MRRPARQSAQQQPAQQPGSEQDMTLWAFISRYLRIVVLIVVVIVIVILLVFYPQQTKEFAPFMNDAAELQASFSGAKLRFVRYEQFEEIIDGKSVLLNHCLLELQPSNGTIFKLPATYTQDADGSTTTFPNENLTIEVDGQFDYTLVGKTFESNGEHTQRCHFSATLTSGPRLMATVSAFMRWVHSTFGAAPKTPALNLVVSKLKCPGTVKTAYRINSPKVIFNANFYFAVHSLSKM